MLISLSCADGGGADCRYHQQRHAQQSPVSGVPRGWQGILLNAERLKRVQQDPTITSTASSGTCRFSSSQAGHIG